jgi:hypothetical protein
MAVRSGAWDGRTAKTTIEAVPRVACGRDRRRGLVDDRPSHRLDRHSRVTGDVRGRRWFPQTPQAPMNTWEVDTGGPYPQHRRAPTERAT